MKWITFRQITVAIADKSRHFLLTLKHLVICLQKSSYRIRMGSQNNNDKNNNNKNPTGIGSAACGLLFTTLGIQFVVAYCIAEQIDEKK